jgi:ADP-heptose:LPS heptosyltransferase
MLDKNSIHSIAIFRALQLGDMLCIIPTIRAVRCAFPNARITLIGLAWQRDLVKRFEKYFDSFIEFPGWPGLPERPWEANTSIEFLQRMQQLKFDLVLQMQGNGILTNSMCLLWGAKNTVGLRKHNENIDGSGIFPVSEDTDHEILRFLKIADALEIQRQGIALEFPISREEEEQFKVAAKLMQVVATKYVCIHPGARDPKRRWDLRKFAKVADEMYNRGYQVVITGSVAERKIIDALEHISNAQLINSIKILSDVSLGVLAALIRGSALLISNDTGVSHIAAALQIPSVIIFSPYSNEKRWAPLNSELHKAVLPLEARSADNVIAYALRQLQIQKEELMDSSGLSTNQ